MASGEFKNLRYEADQSVALVTIDRPAVHNAISLATIEELDRLFDLIERDKNLRALVLTGAGTRTFVSGGDLKDFERLTSVQAAADMSRRMQHAMARMRAMPVAVIGAVNGDALGGGCEVALACDIRIASRTARFGFKQVTIGITPAWGGRQRLVDLVGRSRALHLLLTGRLIGAGEAWRIGLVDELAAPEELVPAALALGREIARQPAGAVRAIKRAVDEGAELKGEAAIEFEADLFARTWMSEDHQEALAARKEDRPPKFRGK